MSLSPVLRRGLLAIHLVASVGWLGAIVVYLALGATAATTTDPAVIRSAWLGLDVALRLAIVPLAISTEVTGIAIAAGTRWGLLRHYWVAISLLLTTISFVVVVVHTPVVASTAAFARTASDGQLAQLGGDVAHPAIGLVLLLVVHVLNVFKPRGLTRHGQRHVAAERRRTTLPTTT